MCDVPAVEEQVVMNKQRESQIQESTWNEDLKGSAQIKMSFEMHETEAERRLHSSPG